MHGYSRERRTTKDRVRFARYTATRPPSPIDTWVWARPPPQNNDSTETVPSSTSTVNRWLLSPIRARDCPGGLDVVDDIVCESDRRARRFYEEHGFETVDCVPDHFESDDRLVLERRCDSMTNRE